MRVLVWLDPLHEGPVPADLSLEALSEVRAAYLGVGGDLKRRDEQLRRYPDHDEVVLWFEHDLFDQLQLIQLLDFFCEHRPARLSLIGVSDYLGTLRPDQLAALFPAR